MTVKMPLFLFLPAFVVAQDIPAKWEELSAADWELALERSARTCILPIGILEKHGLHAPIGTDLIYVREIAQLVTEREYAVVFPELFFGQIYEARHQPGTVALPSRLVWDLLEATCEEIGRNGFRKILLLNGHGGNPHLLRYFVQSQLERRRTYAVFLYDPAPDEEYLKSLKRLRKSDLATDMHAGENETSTMLYLRPDLVYPGRAARESGSDQNRLALPDLYTAIWWYASYPNHYAGDASKATKDLGRVMVEHRLSSLLAALRVVKSDAATLRIQEEFFDGVLR